MHDLTFESRRRYQQWLASEKPELDDESHKLHTSSPFVFTSGGHFIGGCDDTLALLREVESRGPGSTNRRLRAVAQHLSGKPTPLAAAAGAAGGRHCIDEHERALVARFLAAPAFAVVGASKDRAKFGNKILRCYLQHGLVVTPVSPKEPEVEAVRAVKTLSELRITEEGVDVTDVGVSIVTPPAVTMGVLDELSQLGIGRVWLQPGAESEEVLARCHHLQIDALHATGGAGPCVLIELGFRNDTQERH